MGFIIAMLLFFGVLGGAGFVAYKVIEKSNPNNVKNNTDDLLNNKELQNTKTQATNEIVGETSQEFLPYDTIQDGVITLSPNRYRAFIECGSINYSTATPEEQDQIEYSFQLFLNSIDFPFTFYVQTRTIDNTERLKETREECDMTKKTYPQNGVLQDYCDAYLTEMEHIGEIIKNDKQKKKYIIIPFDDVEEYTYVSEEERYINAISQLKNRCDGVIARLNSVGISAKILETSEIYELIYATFTKDYYRDINEVLKDGVIPSVISSTISDKLTNIPLEGKVDRALEEAQNRIFAETYDANLSEEDKAELIEILKRLAQTREEFVESKVKVKKGGKK